MENLTKVEQLIMKCIWKEQESPTIYDIINQLKENYGTEYTRSTTRTYFTKLEKKGYIKLERKGQFSYVIPQISEQEYRKQQMQYMKDFWFDGSIKEMTASFQEILEQDEVNDNLQDLIDGFDD